MYYAILDSFLMVTLPAVSVLAAGDWLQRSLSNRRNKMLHKSLMTDVVSVNMYNHLYRHAWIFIIFIDYRYINICTETAFITKLTKIADQFKIRVHCLDRKTYNYVQ